MAPGQAPAPAPSSGPVIILSLDLAGAGLSNLTVQKGVAVREALADRLHICESFWPCSSLHTQAVYWPATVGLCTHTDVI